MSTTASTAVFYVLAAASVGSAMIVCFSRNLVYCAFALLGTLASSAALYIYLHADFLAATQVIVYVGGIAVLFLFAVMLTNNIERARASNPHFGLKAALPFGLLVTGMGIYAATSQHWKLVLRPDTNPTTSRIGRAFLGTHLLPFELASLILLVVLIGAALVARREINTRIAGLDPTPGKNRTTPGSDPS